MLDDTSTPEAVAIAETEPTSEGTETIAIKVTKGGTIAVDLSLLPDRIYKAVIVHGLQKLVNRKSKLDKTDVMEPMDRAKANLAAMYANTFKIVGSKSSDTGKASGPVMVEARRLAKLAVKAEMKAQKIKVSHVASSEITRLANELIDADASFVKTAEANLKAAEAAVASKATSKLIIKVDPKLVAKAAEAKAKEKATSGQVLSAKQAGKVQVKSKPATK